MLIERPDLKEVHVCLFEVVAEDVVVLAGPIMCRTLEPRGVTFVKSRPRLPGDGFVSRIVADQEVSEAERSLARELRPFGSDQVFADEGREMLGHRGSQSFREELGDRSFVEDLPFDGSSFDRRPNLVAELVETGGQQRVDRGRHLELSLSPAIVEHERHHLLDEKRIAFGGLDDTPTPSSSTASPSRLAIS